MAKDNGNNNKKNSGLLVACWFLLLLLILILFFVKKDIITANLEKTDFFRKVFSASTGKVESSGDRETALANKGSEASESTKAIPFVFDLNTKSSKGTETQVYQEATGSESVKAIQEDAIIMPQGDSRTAEAQNKQNEAAIASNNLKKETPIEKVENSSHGNKQSQGQSPKEQMTQKSETKIPAPQKNMGREATLFFVVIAPDGSVSRKSVKRMLPKSDSPLTDAINALLEGPLPSEREKNCMSLIPQGSRLLGASIKNNVATLDFNESFEFNALGVEGYVAQLMQIVYTSTEFSTVSSVQFLIEGEKRDYLGSEGQWIGTPLSRGSF